MSIALIIGNTGCTSGKSVQPEKITPIILPAPKRPAGQTDVVNLAVPGLDVVRVGFIGLGMRRPGAVKRFIHIEGVEIVALCDIVPERVEKCQKYLTDAGMPETAAYSGSEDSWKELCDCDDIDLVYIATDWKTHTPMAVYAMEKGKHVACEVPIAMTVEECWQLVNTAEKTQKHCMMLENCCYDFYEMATLNMAQKGLLGEIVHAEGAYIHDLRSLLFKDPETGGYYDW